MDSMGNGTPLWSAGPILFPYKTPIIWFNTLESPSSLTALQVLYLVGFMRVVFLAAQSLMRDDESPVFVRILLFVI